MKLRHISAALVAGLLLAAAPAAIAQTAGGAVANGIAIANTDQIIGNSGAYKASIPLLQSTYKAQLDAYNAKANAIRAQLAPLAQKINAAQKAAKPDNAAIQADFGQYQQIQQAGAAEMEDIIKPVKLARQYVIEQIEVKLADATQAAMTKRHVTLVLAEQAVLKHDTVYNLNQDVIDQLNLVLPSVQVVPPAGWVPAQEREQRAQQQAAAQAEAAQEAASAPATAKKQPQGR